MAKHASPAPLSLLFAFFIGIGGALLLGARAPRRPQQCTAIQVPTSSNFPVSVQGVRDPTAGRAGAPILMTITLPAGYVAVGGGDDQVIACTTP